MKKFFSLIAAVLFAGGMMATTVTKTVANLATEKSFENGVVCTPFALDDVITVSTTATDANTGKYYSNGEQIRLYQTGAASITLTAAEGYKISSVTLTYASQNTGILVEAQSGVAVDFENVQSATFTVGNSGAATNGQVRITEFSVTYDADGVSPTPVEEYYLVGSMNEWAVSADYKLTRNTASEGNEYKIDITLTEGNQEMKVKGVLEGRAEDAWYPGGMDNNFTINDAGDYTIYFRPNADGGDGWHEGYILAEYHAPAEPITCLDVYQMAKNDVVDLLNDVTVTFANGRNVWVMDGSASMLIYLPAASEDFVAGQILSGVAGTVDIYNGVYEIKLTADQVAAINIMAGEAPAAIQTVVVETADMNKYIVMPDVAFDADASFTEGSQSNLTINSVTVRNQFKNGFTFEAGKTYNIYGVVTLYQNNPQVYFISAEESGIVEPTVEYQLTGSFRNWGTTVEADYQFVSNPANEGEYMLRRVSLSANDEIKVIGILEPTEGEPTYTWYPAGQDNNYVITEDGEYNIYFRPEGNIEGWHYGYFYVQPYVIPTYDVAEAIAAAPENGDEMYIRGVITKMQIKGKNFVKYGSVNIYVADATGAAGEFEFFNCFSFNADTFRTTTPAYDAEGTTWDDLKKVADENGNEFRLGDTIVAFGAYKLFNTTHELDGGCFITEHMPAPVQPAQEIDVMISTGLRFIDSIDPTADPEDEEASSWWQLYGGDDTYVLSFSNNFSLQVEGRYDLSDLDPDYSYIGIIGESDTTYLSFESGYVDVAVDNDGKVTLIGTLTASDDNIYNFSLAFIPPTADAQVEVAILDGVLDDEYADYGLYAVYGGDMSEVFVQLAIWVEDEFQGVFSEQDLDVEYVGSGIIDGGESVEIYSATINVVPREDGSYAITATVLGYNNTEYTVTMVIPAPDPSGIEETIAAGKAAKILRDGQILIRKADKTFNVMGATIR